MKSSRIKIFLIILLLSNFLLAEGEEGKKKVVSSDDVSFTFFDINNISTPIRCDGIFDDGEGLQSPIISRHSDYTFPKYMRDAGYNSGLLWGGKIDGRTKVGGSNFTSTLKCGYLDNNKNFKPSRIYRVRSDWQEADFSKDAQYYGVDETAIRNSYEVDWNEWPADLGAPFNDVDNDGVYNPSIDIPGVKGADQSIWFIATDFNRNGDETNIEIQVTVWGYRNIEELENVYFRKYKITNKGDKPITDFYTCLWADQDISTSADAIGCDTLLNLGFTHDTRLKSYWLSQQDTVWTRESYFYTAVGYQVLDGIENKYGTNPKMTYHNKILKHSQEGWEEITLGIEKEDSLFYPLFQNRNYFTGEKLVDQITGKETNYYFPGNVLSQTGWYDTDLWDKRSGISNGPIDLMPAQTEELVFSNIGAIGEDLNECLQNLKSSAYKVSQFYNREENVPQLAKSLSIDLQESEDKIKISWEDINNVVSNFSGYEFLGYEVFQLTDSVYFDLHMYEVTTLDKVDGITQVYDKIFNAETEELENVVYYTGNENGSSNIFLIGKDYESNSNLIQGKKYSYFINAVLYDANAAEGSKIIKIKSPTKSHTFHSNYPGFMYSDKIKTVTVKGNGDFQGAVTVTDPSQLIANEYKITAHIDSENNVLYDLINNSNGNLIMSNLDHNNSPLVADGFSISFFNPSLLGRRTGIVYNNKAADTYLIQEERAFLKYPEDLDNSADDYLFKFSQDGSKTLNYDYEWEVYYQIQYGHQITDAGQLEQIRVPLEVWNITKGIRVNFILYNFTSQNSGRIIVLKSPYNEDINNIVKQSFSFDYRTSSRHFYLDLNNFNIGDEIRIEYGGGVRDGDEYLFSTKFGSEKINFTQQEDLIVYENYPNPFNTKTNFDFTLNKESNVKLCIYNILGELVRVVVDKKHSAGNYSYYIQSSTLSSGPYIYRIETDFGSVTKKMLLLK